MSAPPLANAAQCPLSPPLWSLLFSMVVFLALFVLNKDYFGSRKSRSSLLKSISMLFWPFYIGVRFSLFLFCFVLFYVILLE
jgi:ABC-type Na+ efflux pump permease subunit